MSVNSDKLTNGVVAARYGAQLICNAIGEKGYAHVILATGASQFEMLQELVKCNGIDWSKVDCIHLDEYVGMDNTHGASFAKYLQERFVDQLPANNKPKSFTFVDGAGDPVAEIKRLHGIISAWPEIDVSFIGIGENGRKYWQSRGFATLWHNNVSPHPPASQLARSFEFDRTLKRQISPSMIHHVI